MFHFNMVPNKISVVILNVYACFLFSYSPKINTYMHMHLIKEYKPFIIFLTSK